MAKGDVVALEFATVQDPDTGARVTRLTDEAGHHWMPYFTQPLFDGGRLLVHSDRTGSTQLWLLDVSAGRMVQLSDAPNGVGNHQSAILPGRGQAGYFSGRELYRVDLETLETERLYEVAEGFRASILAPSGDGSNVTFSVMEVFPTTTTVPGKQYSAFNETLYRRPTSLVFRVDTQTGAPAALWGEREWISHVIVSPLDDEWVVFCHEGPWDKVQRLWTLRASNNEVAPLLPYPRLLGRAGHEFFCDDGRMGVQYSRRMTSSARDWVHYNALVWPDGREPRFYRFPGRMPSHIQCSHDGRWFVGDCGYVDADDTGGGGFLALLDHRDDERIGVTRLCRHDTSWVTQPSHPHPVFAPDDRAVYFNSDRGGTNAVYSVELPAE